MAQAQLHIPSQEWLNTALAGATVEEVSDDEGTLAGWWAENSDCPGASAYGTTQEEAHERLQEVLAGWVQLGQELDHPIPSIREGEIAAPA
ncbi:type II toxin-antitoxin system HicB family antitoxin [Candidatus Poriferisodalis sp.]|uniref:type II toxin-antitoxin system HicB family antitoxin n=1 Tax=Candidatus Poriferisodalis sp. TaxID=3101277 RepID=UPI003B01AE2C